MSYAGLIAAVQFALLLFLGVNPWIAIAVSGFTFVILDAISDTSERR